jgi:UDP-N-acetylglucosamine 2-epimerase (non-hydrolysing)
MKVMTVLGTRPEIIRLSRVIERLDECSTHVLVHTGQNFADCLSGIFFRELGLREPDVFLDASSDSFGEQVGRILARFEPVLAEYRPDRLLILGDTNSGLTAVVARRMGVPVYHMEAGNRCYDFRVPEETNRRIIDHVSDVLLPYTERSRENLLREGLPAQAIHVIGNPIHEVMQHYRPRIDGSDVLERLGLDRGRYFLVTMHRAENVDVENRLRQIIDALHGLHRAYGLPVVCSLHPRTAARMQQFSVAGTGEGIRFIEPVGFFDFVRLEQAAFCVLSDSGTVQEETCILGVPNVTIRDTTERPETVECGSNVIAGVDPERILGLVRCVVERGADWAPPPEYVRPNVADTVVRIVLGHRPARDC